MIYITSSSGKYVYVPSGYVVIFTLSLWLQVNIITFHRGTYTYFLFGESYLPPSPKGEVAFYFFTWFSFYRG